MGWWKDFLDWLELGTWTRLDEPCELCGAERMETGFRSKAEDTSWSICWPIGVPGSPTGFHINACRKCHDKAWGLRAVRRVKAVDDLRERLS